MIFKLYLFFDKSSILLFESKSIKDLLDGK